MYLKKCIVECRADFIKVDIDEVLKCNSVIKKWAYVLHDKDKIVPHYHIYLDFGVLGVDTKQVTEWFRLKETCVCKIVGSKRDLFLYLSHAYVNNNDMYEYVYTDIKSNFSF